MDQWPNELKPTMLLQGRKRLRMEQTQFAEAMGCSSNTISQWETGRRVPRGSAWRMFLILMSHHGIDFAPDGIAIDAVRNPMLDKTKKRKKAA